jgi:hypothetical protein
MKREIVSTILFLTVVIFVSFAFSNQAHAYAVGTTSTPVIALPGSSSWLSIAERWVEGLFTSGSLTQNFATSVHNGLAQFDTWLYGVAGFHIINLLTTVLTILSWILGWLKGGVDWLIGVLK